MTFTFPFNVVDRINDFVSLRPYVYSLGNTSYKKTLTAYFIVKAHGDEQFIYLLQPYSLSRTKHDLFMFLSREGLNGLGHTLWILSRNLEASNRRLRCKTVLETEFRSIKQENALVNLRDQQSYSAAEYMRARVAELVAPERLPAHAQEKHLCTDALSPTKKVELDHLLSWRRRHGAHTSLGSVCLSVECSENYYCSSARKRAASIVGVVRPWRIKKSKFNVIDDMETPRVSSMEHHVIEGGSMEHHVIEGSSIEQQVIEGASMEHHVIEKGSMEQHVIEGGSMETMNRQKCKLEQLPQDVTTLIFEYLYSCGDIAALASQMGRMPLFLVHQITRLPLFPLLQHFQTNAEIEKLAVTRQETRQATNMAWQAPCSRVYDSYSHLLSEVLHAYTAYRNVYLQLTSAVAQYSIEERQIMLDDFLLHTKQYELMRTDDMVPNAPTSNGTKKKQVMRVLNCLDFRLLDMFAFDVLLLQDERVHALPPRAFYRSSKHQKNYRREFTAMDVHTTHRGAALLVGMETLREDLRQQKKTLYRALRGVEAFEVTHTQRLMDELHDSGVVTINPTHPCARVSSLCNSLLKHDELDVFCEQMVMHAEMSGDEKHELVCAVLHNLRCAIASKQEYLTCALFHGMVSTPCASTFINWRLYMSNLLKSLNERREDARVVSIRIATRLQHDTVRCSTNGAPSAGTTTSIPATSSADGFTLFYQNSRGGGYEGRGRQSLGDIVQNHCLAVHGVFSSSTKAAKWPNTIAGAHVVVSWTLDVATAPVVLLRDVSAQTRDVLDMFIVSESNVTETLKQHARLTGKCAPCGRSLKGKNIWIGTTCAGHLPSNWQ